MSDAPPESGAAPREPVPRLVRRISLPVVTGLFFQTMYNVVDTWAAGRLSTDALAALTASFPVYFLVIAVGHGCQAAANALVSHRLGAEDRAGARELGGQAVCFALAMGFATAALGWSATPFLLEAMNVRDEPLRLGVLYMRTLFWSTPFFTLSATLNGLLGAHGETRPFRNALIAGFLLNIVFDLWFVFGGPGLRPMGFAGIARATVLLQGLTFIYLWITARRHGALSVHALVHLHPRWSAQRRFMALGFPALVNMLTIAAGIFVYTSFAAGVGPLALAAFGTAMRIEQIALLPAIGLNTAAMTLAGHSLGARRMDRLRETLFTCLRAGAWICLAGTPLIAGFAPFWMARFTDDPEVVSTGATLLRISMLAYYAYILLFVITSLLQGLQRPLFAVGMGVLRQIVLPLLIIPFLMARLDPPSLGIWWSAVVCTWTGAGLTVVYWMYVWRDVNRNTPSE